MDRVTRNLLSKLEDRLEEGGIIDELYARQTSRRRRRGGFASGGGTTQGSFDATNVEHHDLNGILEDDHTQYVHNTSARNITAKHTFKHATPFAVDNDTLITNLNADKLDGYNESSFFKLADNETITGIPNFNGGETGVSAPFTVDSTDVVTSLNADLWDGKQFADYLNQDVKSTASPTHADLTISSPSNIYALSHDSFADFVANEHIDWTSASSNFSTSGTAAMADLTVTTTNNIKLSLRETSTHKVDFTVGDTGQLTIHPSGNSIMLHNDSNLGSASYVSGFAGSGWQLNKDSSNEYSAEFVNLTVRGTMSVYELLIQQIRATNGSLMVTSADKVVAMESLGGSPTVYKLTVEADDSNDFIHFRENDLILAQKWTGGSGSGGSSSGGSQSTTIVKRIRATVTETSNSGGSSLSAKEFKVTLYGSDSIAASDLPLDFVRIGNTSDNDRQGGVYITSEDTQDPFIDIFDDVDSWADWRLPAKTKARLGKIGGITYDDGSGSGFDIPDGRYGLFSNDVYLTGKITATSGFIGDNNAGWEIGSNYLKNVGNTSFIGIGSGGYNNANQYVWLGAADVSGTTKGKFSLGDKLVWDGSSLTVQGTIKISDGTEVSGAGITWRGAWAAGTQYSINDGVSYSSASYICKSGHTSTNNTSTSTGKPDTSSSSAWDLMADQGSDGADGSDGAAELQVVMVLRVVMVMYINNLLFLEMQQTPMELVPHQEVLLILVVQ